MLFNSYVFIFVFLPVVLAGYALVRRHPERGWVIAWLVLASLFYYGWWNPWFLLLLLFSVTVNAVFGRILCSQRLSKRASGAVLAAGLAFNLALLGYFKYAGFFVENLNAAFGAGFAVPQILLPIGISFITFQKIAFLVDAHRGLVRNFTLRNYALFVTFFPQLIAGPIVHHAEVMPQFAARPPADHLSSDLAVGFSIFIVGLFKKVVIADACAVYADAGYETLKAGNPLGPASAWIAVFAYSLQLYYDFSGYSDMAVGLARMFGIRLPVNFHSPYKSASIIEFWRRWHMTLSRFLRDYLYLPLGGNRRGPLRRYLNMAIVMLLGGLWHGANWTFVVWGGVHGAMLIVNHAWRSLRISSAARLQGAFARRVSILVTFFAVTLAWVPFRATNMAEARRMFDSLFPTGPASPSLWRSLNQFRREQFRSEDAFNLITWFKPKEFWPSVLPHDFIALYRPAGFVLFGVLLLTFLAPNSNQLFARFDPVLGLTPAELQHRRSLQALDWKAALVLGSMFVLSVLQLSRVSPFLYFQF